MFDIVIVNYGMGNLGSIQNMLKKIGVKSEISNSVNGIERANKIILPGVGAFDAAMTRLRAMGLVDVLNEKILKDSIPILGICLGMQLMTRGSEEGLGQGLGWLDADTVRFKFPATTSLKTPHMGWNTVSIQSRGSLFQGIIEPLRFYFVHSYYVICHDQKDVLTTTHYGYDFVSSVQHKNIMGTQFHPEKSHRFGIAVLKNFIEMI